MIVLLDTSTPLCKLTLVVDGNWHESQWQADRTLALNLLGYLQEKIAEHSKQLTDITGIGVFQGPGSFTGLRIGLTMLNTIADSQQIPIVGTVGDVWREDALERLKSNENDELVMPEYGGDAHITTPRK